MSQLGRGDEVVEHVLLVSACAGLCQASPYSAPTAQVGER
jgi:hypothetical protein